MLQQTQSTPPHESEDSEALVEIHGLSLRGPRGWVYRDVELTARPDRLTVITGSAGAAYLSPAHHRGPDAARRGQHPRRPLTPSPGGQRRCDVSPRSARSTASTNSTTP